jgi:hypothetical protein
MTSRSGEAATETRNISRKDAKAAKMENGKFEARNPKFETNSNDQTTQDSKQL